MDIQQVEATISDLEYCIEQICIFLYLSDKDKEIELADYEEAKRDLHHQTKKLLGLLEE